MKKMKELLAAGLCLCLWGVQTVPVFAEEFYDEPGSADAFTDDSSGAQSRSNLNTFTILYDANGGSGTMDPTVHSISQPSKIAKNLFTRTGYAFVGWRAYLQNGAWKAARKNADGLWEYAEYTSESKMKQDGFEFAIYPNGTQISRLMPSAGEVVTLRAQWKKTEHVTPSITPEAGEISMFRLYNPNSGEHFYTHNENEKKNLICAGWKDEGTGWKAPSASATPVYRLYNENAGDHHYTADKAERDALIRLGWKDEGIGWFSADSKEIPLYRQYNPKAKTGTHNYTADKNEHKCLVRCGWRDEGIAWYGLK